MTYVLKKATDQDKEKILQDAIKFKKAWRFPTLIECLDMTLAINEEKKAYMYKAPLTRDSDNYDRYYFYFKDILYELCSKMFSVTELLRLADPINVELLPEFQQEIRDAFLVYNRRGRALGEMPENWLNKLNFELDMETINHGDDLR